MKFIDKKDASCLNILEKDVRNKFCWDWLAKLDSNECLIETWCKKIDQPGECYCVWCRKTIKYQKGGLKNLKSHSESSQHKKAKESVKNTLHLFSYGAESTVNETQTVDINSRKVRIESVLCSFLAENSLSFSDGPKLLELAKVLSKDPKALHSTKMCRSAVAYKMKYGVAKTIKEKLIEDMKENAFSLNIDESTNRAHKSVLTILVQYFSSEKKKLLIQHFASVELLDTSSNTIFETIANLIETNNIPWENLISILFDSCNTMRGIKAGVESLVRINKAPHLLSMSGDTCHTVNNCAKKFTGPFNKNIENLCDMLHFDLQSVHQRKLFFQICEILNLKQLVPLHRPDHRWIYVLPAVERIILLWDALLVHYYSWATKSDKSLYEDMLKKIFKQRSLEPSAVKKLTEIQLVLKSKKLTPQGKERKVRIFDNLFICQKRTLLELNVYKDILPIFSGYIKLFESEKPLIHELHTQMYSIIKKFLSFFMKSELISACNTYKDFKNLKVADKNDHLSDRFIFTGAGANKLISEYKLSDHSVCMLINVLKKAYILCSCYMLEKLPYDNSVLIAFSSLDPQLRGQSAVLKGLLKLGKFASSVLSDEEKYSLDEEIRFYQIDDRINRLEYNCSLSDGEMIPRRIDEYWGDVFALTSSLGTRAYPVLSKVVKAMISCFHGPVVESSFSYMENIITDHRTKLDVESLDSYHTIKYYLKANNLSSIEAFSSECPETDPVERQLLKNMQNSWEEYQKYLKNKNSEKLNQKSEVKNVKNMPQPTCSKFQESDFTTQNEATCSKFDLHKPNFNYQNVEKCSIPNLPEEENSQERSTTKRISSEPVQQRPKKQAKLTNFFLK